MPLAEWKNLTSSDLLPGQPTGLYVPAVSDERLLSGHPRNFSQQGPANDGGGGRETAKVLGVQTSGPYCQVLPKKKHKTQTPKTQQPQQ